MKIFLKQVFFKGFSWFDILFHPRGWKGDKGRVQMVFIYIILVCGGK